MSKIDEMTPTLFLTNWSSRNTPGMFGPGRAYTIMAEPRQARGEYGAGRVEALTPSGPMIPLLHELIATRRMGVQSPALAEYRRLFEAAVESCDRLGPARLRAQPWRDLPPVDVCDGDTLACACSKAEAAAGRCHRVWSAPFLARAGWRVRLDGVEFQEVTNG